MSIHQLRGAHLAVGLMGAIGLAVVYMLTGALVGTRGTRSAGAPRHEVTRPPAGTGAATTARPIVLDGLVGRDSAAAPKATLLLSSSPPGLVVRVDGREVGPLPTNVRDLTPGHHVVTASLPAFEPFERVVDVDSTDVESLVVRLDPMGPGGAGEYGFLRVEDATPGRSVRLLDVEVGVTPLEHVAVPTGAYTVSIVDGRGRVDERAVVVTANHETTMIARPARRRAR